VERSDRDFEPVLTVEYSVLMTALNAAWAASLNRSSIFLAVVSAAGIALGFAVQGGVTDSGFTTIALVILPLVAFLGVTTFVRLVQVQREAFVYTIGMNRIRRAMRDAHPGVAPYLVLPVHDDASALFRSIGTGMVVRGPRRPFLHLLAQTQGIVGVVTAVVTGATVGLAVTALGVRDDPWPWLLAIASGAATLIVLFAWWRRSFAEVQAAAPPRFPTPPDEVGAPW
jgi:hypothetical protein